MEKRIALTKAARLAGIKRTDLQRLIKAGELPTFEGEVLLDDLIKLFPSLNIKLHDQQTDIHLIQKASYSNRTQKRFLGKMELTEELFDKYRVQLLVEKQKAHMYEHVLEDLLQFMTDKRLSVADDQVNLLNEITEWLAHAIQDSHDKLK
ncbi:MAG: hypothetical protein OEZ58_02910 [Gammaproteobacteria bacterium]|nr:hypothetical protein [Gammaproteobacteria bacterium]MDH5727914.1 hypothetical protein [Gammaproteobacteria bacterium]